jgi:hypothetical protein
MMEYLPSIVAFGAALLAIAGGKKAVSQKRGSYRLTRTGWLALGLAVAALGSGVALTWRSQQIIESQARQRAILRSVAHAEVRLSLQTITGWFFELLGDDRPEARFTLVPAQVFDTKSVQAAQTIDIRKPLTIFSPPTTWAELLQTSADRGSQQLTQALQIYAPYLEPEVLALLSELRTSEFLVMRLRGLRDHVDMNKHVERLGFHFVDPPGMLDHMDTGWERFWRIVARLDALLERDTTRLARRLAP